MKLSDFELLYDLPAGQADARAIDGVRTVTVRAGRSLEVMCFPKGAMTPGAVREAKARRSRPAVQKINDRNRERHMMRLIEANFTEAAQVITCTYAYPAQDYGFVNLKDLKKDYDARRLPWEVADVRRDMRNFLARLKRRADRDGQALKWLLRIEEGKEPPAFGLPPKYHAHLIVEGVSREAVKACWDHGSVRCDDFDLTGDGAARLARYLNKQKVGGRWWSHSRNLIAPTPTVSDRKVSRRRLLKIAADVTRDGRQILETLYPGYQLMEEPLVRYSDFAPGCYIYARLRKWRD